MNIFYFCIHVWLYTWVWWLLFSCFALVINKKKKYWKRDKAWEGGRHTFQGLLLPYQHTYRVYPDMYFFPNIFKILKFLPAIANFLGIQPVRSGYPTDIRFNGKENGWILNIRRRRRDTTIRGIGCISQLIKTQKQ